MQLLSALTDDTLLLVLSDLQRGASWTRGEDVVDVVALSSVCHDARKRLAGSLEDIRTSLPPPYSPTALDVALAAGDADIATPLLREAMKRLGRNIETISTRLLDRGYPVATECAACGRRFLAPVPGLTELSASVRERGVQIPLALQILWEELGGIALASPADGAHLDWWRAVAPEVEEAAGAPFAPDPLWIDHAVEVLRAASDEQSQPPLTLPVGFSDEEGFVFRQGHVLHLSPDAFAKRQANVSSAAVAAGSYAVWLDAAPALDPELLRFTPPTEDGDLGGAEPLLWRAQCSLLSYLRLAVLEAGGFPGCLGVPEYETLRGELTDGLKAF